MSVHDAFPASRNAFLLFARFLEAEAEMITQTSVELSMECIMSSVVTVKDKRLSRGKYLLPALLQSKTWVVCCLCPQDAENTPTGRMLCGRVLKNSTNWEYKPCPGSSVACCRLESTVSTRLNANFHTEELIGQVLVTKA